MGVLKALQAALLITPLALQPQDLAQFEKKVTEFTLPNGMHFIVLERREAPVVSFHAHVDAGAVNDPSGRTGLAHMFEHMIGKGTQTLGSKNWPLEKKALDHVEQVYDQLEAEQRKGPRADEQQIKILKKQLDEAIEKANGFAEPNYYVELIERSGGAGFNAGTGADSTVYHYSLPANRIELWFMLQSEWLRRPAFREFYKERDVVLEERRMRIESNPQGQLQEMLMATAFAAHPYRTMIGWASDIANLRVKDAQAFFRTYYVPGNITIAIAGDIDPAQARRLADKYFSPLNAGPLPPLVTTQEPPQDGQKRVIIESATQPILMIAYKRPSQYDKDDAAIDVLSGILSSGRTGLLYKELVRDKKISLAAGAAGSVPASKYDNLFLLYAVPSLGHPVEDNEKAIYEILERVKKEKPDAESLQRIKTKLRASLIRQLDSNPGLAEQLAFYHVNFGSWKKLFTGLEEIDKVTADDVQRVAQRIFAENLRTVAFTAAPAKAAATGASK